MSCKEIIIDVRNFDQYFESGNLEQYNQHVNEATKKFIQISNNIRSIEDEFKIINECWNASKLIRNLQENEKLKLQLVCILG